MSSELFTKAECRMIAQYRRPFTIADDLVVFTVLGLLLAPLLVGLVGLVVLGIKDPRIFDVPVDVAPPGNNVIVDPRIFDLPADVAPPGNNKTLFSVFSLGLVQAFFLIWLMERYWRARKMRRLVDKLAKTAGI